MAFFNPLIREVRWRSVRPVWLAVCVCLVLACNPRKKMADHEVFFKKYRISVHDAPSQYRVETGELETLVRLRPNRNVAWNRFNLWMYNLVDTAKRRQGLEAKTLKLAHRDSLRVSRGKEPKNKKVRTFRSWLSYTVGEPPVVFDSVKVAKSAQQMEVYLHKKGFFSATVNPEVTHIYRYKGLWYLQKKGNRIAVSKAKVDYRVYPGKPYLVRKRTFTSKDPALASRLDYFAHNRLLDSLDVFDVSVLDKERENFTSFLNNRGYYDFSKDFIYYDVDTTAGMRMVDVRMVISSNRGYTAQSPDSLVNLPHAKYFIGRIEVHTNYASLNPDYKPADTTFYGGVYFIHQGPMSISTDMVLCSIGFNEGDQYERDRMDQTYKRLSALQVFSQVSIRLVPRAEPLPGGGRIIDCQVQLTPAMKQMFNVNPRFTHRGDNLGFSGDLSYRHRNLLGGAEALRVGLNAGVEAQQLLTQTVQTNTQGQVSTTFRPNTFEIGPEVSVRVPRLVPFGCDFTRRSSEPSTTFTALYNYQDRPDYTRTVSQLKASWNWIENAARGSRFQIDLPEFSVVKIRKSPAFDEYLNRVGDQFLLNTFSNHLILGNGFTWTQNNQRTSFQRFYSFLRFHIEYSGWVRHIQELVGAQRAPLGHFELFKVQYAEYAKADVDLRQYVNLDAANTLVFRAAGGLGEPLQNLKVLPFEKSFFAGGTNGIRAWRARSLGPGSFRDTTQLRVFNALGELKMEFNFEYRFKLTQMFGGAFFVDAGNVWLQKPDKLRPGSDFNIERFTSEIAVGTGLGARLDFDFFLVRFDFGLQLKDPAKVPGERWIWEPKDEFNQFISRFNTDTRTYRYSPQIIFNLGIGYPF